MYRKMKLFSSRELIIFCVENISDNASSIERYRAEYYARRLSKSYVM